MKSQKVNSVLKIVRYLRKVGHIEAIGDGVRELEKHGQQCNCARLPVTKLVVTALTHAGKGCVIVKREIIALKFSGTPISCQHSAQIAWSGLKALPALKIIG